MTSRPTDFFISLLIPVYNEEQNISVLFAQVLAHISVFNRYEIIFIDDGSTDDTFQKIKQLQQGNSNVHYLTLSKNFGHQNALKAGLDFCTGDVVISMDGDLQHPPALIPKMIDCWRNGYDAVVTTRKDIKETSLVKKFTSRYFYRLLSIISCIELKPGTADFRLLDRTVVEELKRFDENDIFFRGFVAWLGFRQFELSYTPDKRIAGETKYTLKKMFRLASSGLFGFSILPLRMVSLIGAVISCLSFLYGFYAILIRFFSEEVVFGWASIMTGIYFLGGIQLVCIGICGEYIGRIFMQVKNRPHYVIADTSLRRQ